LTQDLAGALEDRLADRGHAREVLAAALEDLDAELVLEQAHLLADAGLRREQALRGRRDIEVVAGDLPDVAQLLQFHGVGNRRTGAFRTRAG
jgi:hypothetical protein